MCDDTRAKTGSVVWTDLTVAEAPGIRDFYSKVVGWKSEALSMGDYDDFVMCAPSDGEQLVGICHARGENAGLPPMWLPYFAVPDIEASQRAVKELGGEILAGTRVMNGYGSMCVVRDPAGAVCALFQQAEGAGMAGRDEKKECCPECDDTLVVKVIHEHHHYRHDGDGGGRSGRDWDRDRNRDGDRGRDFDRKRDGERCRDFERDRDRCRDFRGDREGARDARGDRGRCSDDHRDRDGDCRDDRRGR